MTAPAKAALSRTVKGAYVSGIARRLKSRNDDETAEFVVDSAVLSYALRYSKHEPNPSARAVLALLPPNGCSHGRDDVGDNATRAFSAASHKAILFFFFFFLAPILHLFLTTHTQYTHRTRATHRYFQFANRCS